MTATLPLLFVALYTLAVPALAADNQPVSGANGHLLLAECSEILNFLDTGSSGGAGIGGSYCLGMLNGMLNLNYIYQAQYQQTQYQPAPLFCLPHEITVTNAEAAQVVVRYLKRHPEQLDLDQSSLMFFAFQQAYPCS